MKCETSCMNRCKVREYRWYVTPIIDSSHSFSGHRWIHVPSWWTSTRLRNSSDFSSRLIIMIGIKIVDKANRLFRCVSFPIATIIGCMCVSLCLTRRVFTLWSCGDIKISTYYSLFQSCVNDSCVIQFGKPWRIFLPMTRMTACTWTWAHCGTELR